MNLLRSIKIRIDLLHSAADRYHRWHWAPNGFLSMAMRLIDPSKSSSF
jgi:hypothetical protein